MGIVVAPENSGLMAMSVALVTLVECLVFQVGKDTRVALRFAFK